MYTVCVEKYRHTKWLCGTRYLKSVGFFQKNLFNTIHLQQLYVFLLRPKWISTLILWVVYKSCLKNNISSKQTRDNFPYFHTKIDLIVLSRQKRHRKFYIPCSPLLKTVLVRRYITFDSLKRTFIDDKRLLVDLRIIRSSIRNNMIDYDKVLKIFRKTVGRKTNKYENVDNCDFALSIMRLRVQLIPNNKICT